MRRVVGAMVVMVLATAACRSPARSNNAGVTLDASRPATQAAPAVVAARQTQSFTGIFPFSTRAELDAYANGADQLYRDPVRTAREFAVRYLGFTTPILADQGYQAGEPGAGEVPIGVTVGGQFQLATTVVVRQLGGQGSTDPWTVVAASSPRIRVDSPDPLQRISSPVAVSGRADAFEGTVNVDIREDGQVAGASLGSGFATAEGQGGPFRTDVTFRAPTKPGGAVILQDRSGAGVGETNAYATTVVRVVYGAVDRTG